MLYYTVIKTKHNGTEHAGFRISRPAGTDDYLFLHFKTPVIFDLCGKSRRIESGECILLAPGTPPDFYPDGDVLVHDWMHFMPSDQQEYMKLKIDTNNFFTPVEPSIITSAVKRCEYELISKDEFYQDVVSSEVTSMFIRLNRQMTNPAAGAHTDILKSLRLDIYRIPSN